MTRDQFEALLVRFPSIDACDAYLQTNIAAIRHLFYGLTAAELRVSRLGVEDFFLRFESSPVGRQLQSTAAPASIQALLLFFLSLFERADLHDTMIRVARLLPVTSSVGARTEAIFLSKNITDSSRDYVDRFYGILKLLNGVWQRDPSEEVRSQCTDILRAYYSDAIILPQAAGLVLRTQIKHLFASQEARRQFPVLNQPSLQSLLSASDDTLRIECLASRSRIVESLHEEACRLVPTQLLIQPTTEPELPSAPQIVNELPRFLLQQLEHMKAVFNRQPGVVRLGLAADDERNRAYLGTYFPRTFVESTNILTELLALAPIRQAFSNRDVIRILDIGSGTGGAVVGTLAALQGQGVVPQALEITSVDGNADALAKQEKVLHIAARNLNLSIRPNFICRPFATTLDGFVDAMSSFAAHEGRTYDVILVWKCLCEFYNTNYAQASGIVTNALRIASGMLSPSGLCILLDLTSNDNKFEFFSMTLNREANAYEATGEAAMATVVPIPCARHAKTCTKPSCFTQRRFVVQLPSKALMESKVAYRVFAPIRFASTITATYGKLEEYAVNAARPSNVCRGGAIVTTAKPPRCGFTEFVVGRR